MLSGTICQKNDQEPMRIQNSGQTIVSIDAIDHSIEKYFLVYKIWFAYLANFRMRIDELNAVSYHILIVYYNNKLYFRNAELHYTNLHLQNFQVTIDLKYSIKE